MPPDALPIRIYYEDTDFSGAVYHARYLHFFERGRTEALRAVGIDQRALHEAAGGPFGFVVRRMTLSFDRPARMDDLVLVETAITRLGAATIEMRQTLLRDGTSLARADLALAFVAAGAARRLPSALRATLLRLAGA